MAGVSQTYKLALGDGGHGGGMSTKPIELSGGWTYP